MAQWVLNFYNGPMDKFIAGLQVVAAVILALLAVATLINTLFIATRPETISVVNTFIGQGVLIICLAALSRVLLRRGLRGLKAESGPGQDAD